MTAAIVAKSETPPPGTPPPSPPPPRPSGPQPTGPGRTSLTDYDWSHHSAYRPLPDDPRPTPTPTPPPVPLPGALMPGEATAWRGAVASPSSQRILNGRTVMRAAAATIGIQLATLHPVTAGRLLLVVLTAACIPLGGLLRRMEAQL